MHGVWKAQGEVPDLLQKIQEALVDFLEVQGEVQEALGEVQDLQP